MKLCRFDEGRYGLIEGGRILDVTGFVRGHPAEGDPLVQSLPALAALSGSAREGLASRPLDGVAWLSPIRAPGKIIAAPNNYHAHLEEMRANAKNPAALRDLKEAGLFLLANSSLVGPSQGIAIRFLERRTDHEVELVVVIGKLTDSVPQNRALDHVAGYCLGLDITLRGGEERSLRKSIDTYTVLGPWLATTDEAGEADDIPLELSVNGTVRQSGSTSDMVYGVRDLVAYASRYYTLYPGDLLFTGTPSGVGPIHPGDVIRASAGILGACDIAVRAAMSPSA